MRKTFLISFFSMVFIIMFSMSTCFASKTVDVYVQEIGRSKVYMHDLAELLTDEEEQETAEKSTAEKDEL